MGGNKDYKKDHYRPYSSYYGNNNSSSSSNHNNNSGGNSLSNNSSNKRYYGSGSMNNSGAGSNSNSYYSSVPSSNINGGGGPMRRKYNSNGSGYNSYRGGGNRYSHDGGMHYESSNNSSSGNNGPGIGNHDHYYVNSGHHHSHHHYSHHSNNNSYYGYGGSSNNKSYHSDKSDHTNNSKSLSSNAAGAKPSSNSFHSYRGRQLSEDHHKGNGSNIDREHHSYHSGNSGDSSPYRYYQKELFPKKLQSEDSSSGYKRYNSAESNSAYNKSTNKESSSRQSEYSNIKSYSSPRSNSNLQHNQPSQVSSQSSNPTPQNTSSTNAIGTKTIKDDNKVVDKKKDLAAGTTASSKVIPIPSTGKPDTPDNKVQSIPAPQIDSSKLISKEKNESGTSVEPKNEKIKNTDSHEVSSKLVKEAKKSSQGLEKRKANFDSLSSANEEKRPHDSKEQEKKSTTTPSEKVKHSHKEESQDKKIHKHGNDLEKERKHKIKEVIKKVELNKDPQKKHSLFKNAFPVNSSSNLKKSGLFKHKETIPALHKDKNHKSEKEVDKPVSSNQQDVSSAKNLSNKSDSKKSTPEISSNIHASESSNEIKKKPEQKPESIVKFRRIIDSEEESEDEISSNASKLEINKNVTPEKKRPIDSLFSDDEAKGEKIVKVDEQQNKKSKLVDDDNKDENFTERRKDSFSNFKSSPLSDLGMNSVDMESEPGFLESKTEQIPLSNQMHADIQPINENDKISRDVESDDEMHDASSDNNDDEYHDEDDEISESETIVADFPPKSRRARGKLVRISDSVDSSDKSLNYDDKLKQSFTAKKKSSNEKKLIDKRDHSGRTKLMRMCSSGKYDEAKDLIEAGADVNMTDYAGTSILHEVALKGYYDIAKLLIEHDVNMNVKSRDDSATPVYDAACNSNFDIVELLLENGADPNICGSGNESLYSFLFNEGDEGRAILKKFPNIAKDTIIFDEYDQYFIDLIDSDEFYEKTAKCDMNYIVDQLDKGHKPNATAVIIACIYGFTEMISFFLAFGFKVNTYSSKGTIPLHHAVGKKHFDLIQLLIQTDADPRIVRKSDGLNSLQIATRLDADKEVITLLRDTISKLNGKSSGREKRPFKSKPSIKAEDHELSRHIEAVDSRNSSKKHEKESSSIQQIKNDSVDNIEDTEKDEDSFVNKKRKLDTKKQSLANNSSNKESKKERIKVIKVKPLMKTSKLFNASIDDQKPKKVESKDEITDSKHTKEKDQLKDKEVKEKDQSKDKIHSKDKHQSNDKSHTKESDFATDKVDRDSIIDKVQVGHENEMDQLKIQDHSKEKDQNKEKGKTGDKESSKEIVRSKNYEPTIRKETIIAMLTDNSLSKLTTSQKDTTNPHKAADSSIHQVALERHANHKQDNIKNSHIHAKDSNDHIAPQADGNVGVKEQEINVNQDDADSSMDTVEADQSKEAINADNNSLNQKMKEAVKRKQKMLLEKITANEKLRQKEKEEKKKRDEEKILREKEEVQRQKILIREKEEEEKRQKSLLKNKKTRESYPVTLQCVQFYSTNELKGLNDYSLAQTNFKQYLPLYYTTINNEKYVIDLQLNLITGISDLYDSFPILNNDKIIVKKFEQKKLWNFFSSLLMRGFLDISVLTESEEKADNKSMILRRYENFEKEGKKFECLLLNWVKLSTFQDEILPSLSMYQNLLDFEKDVIQLDQEIFIDKADNDDKLSVESISPFSSASLTVTAPDSLDSSITSSDSPVTGKLPRKFFGRKMLIGGIKPNKSPLW